MIPKPKHKRRKTPLNMPVALIRQVDERDKHICQRSGERGTERHHIVPAGIGRRRVHTIENLITLSHKCHRWAHDTKEGREWCENWSRERYGNVVDLIKQYGHRWREHENQGQ